MNRTRKNFHWTPLMIARLGVLRSRGFSRRKIVEHMRARYPGLPEKTIFRYRREIFPKGEPLKNSFQEWKSKRVTYEQRKRQILVLQAKLTPDKIKQRSLKAAASLTPEQRKQRALKAAASLTLEQRSKKSSKSAASMTPEKRRKKAWRISASRRESLAAKTTDPRRRKVLRMSAAAKRRFASMTPEQRSELALKREAANPSGKKSQAAKKRDAAMSPRKRARRSLRMSKAHERFQASLTPEERRRRAQPIMVPLTPEQQAMGTAERNRLFEENLSLVDSAVRGYWRRPEFDDIRQEAELAFLEILGKWDRKMPLEKLAKDAIARALIRFFSKRKGTALRERPREDLEKEFGE